MRLTPVLCLLAGAPTVYLGGCASSSGPPLPEKFEQRSPVAGAHDGPPVDQGQTGSARFVHGLLDVYDAEAAMGVATFLDGFYRAPASEGYEESIERVLAALYGAGFGATEGYELSTPRRSMGAPAWTPGLGEARRCCRRPCDPGGQQAGREAPCRVRSRGGAHAL